MRLVLVEECQVDLYREEITAALAITTQQVSQVYVPLWPICDYLGLDWSTPRKRLSRDEILKEFQGRVWLS